MSDICVSCVKSSSSTGQVNSISDCDNSTNRKQTHNSLPHKIIFREQNIFCSVNAEKDSLSSDYGSLFELVHVAPKMLNLFI
jgi:hypothetical protein